MTRRAFLLGAMGLEAPMGVPMGALMGAAPVSEPGPPIEPILAYEAATGGKVGLYAENRATGKRLGWRARERFVMCITFKASLAACVLHRADHGALRLDEGVTYGPADVPDWWAPVAKANLQRGAMSLEEMCRAAVENSDNTCATLLLTRIGGPPALTRFWRALGDETSRLDDTEPVLNRTPLGGTRDTTTPIAMAGVLRRLIFEDVLSTASRMRLTGWLVGCKTGDNRLRAGLPKTVTIGDKTGNNGADAAGDIAVIWPGSKGPVIACVYTRGGAPTAIDLDQMFAGVGRAIADALFV